MKITAQEEYGLRCALQLARAGASGSRTIPEIADREGLSTAYVAKLLQLLRTHGLVRSVRGRSGGYTLGRPSAEITISDVLAAMGHQPWDAGGCRRFSGALDVCIHSSGCSIRSLWGVLDTVVDQLLRSVNLADLLDGGRQAAARFCIERGEAERPAVAAAVGENQA
jgi:Rrf2 family protein